MPSRSFSPWNMKRRSFFKLSAAALATAATSSASAAPGGRQITSLPTPSDLASTEMEFSFTDLFQLPVFQNELGYGQVSKSVSGVTGISFPPFACCGAPDVMLSPGLLTSCELIINGQLLSIAPGNRVTYRWLPQRVDREQVVAGLRIRTRTFMPPRERAVTESIEITNVGSERKDLVVGFDMQAAVIKKTSFWMVGTPGEGGNDVRYDASSGAIVFAAQHTPAVSVQGIHPPAKRLRGGHILEHVLQLRPGESQRFTYVNAIAETSEDARRIYSRLQSQFVEVEQSNESFHADMLKAVFTPRNSYFSGHLPTLHTDDETLWNLYFTGIKNLLSARRHSPDSKYGPTYLTLGGHTLPTLSFPWDTSLTGLSLALLDPDRLRNLVEVWFVQEMHQRLATDYVSGTGVGQWYAVNDTAIVRCARDYLRVTGDLAWLDKRVGDKTVIGHLLDHALYWEKLLRTDRGLADYGNIENLLEVVSTYLHEVAGMNAGNLSSMRFVADLLERRGESAQAKELRAKSQQLAERINRLLYVEGKGWWRAGQLDGSFNEVRHCYDFLAVSDSMLEDLSPQQRAEMRQFFWQELHTRSWMRALSAGDDDVTWNIRPDHSALGAYAAWPPMSAKALYRLGMPEDQMAGWLRELAKAGNQGPIGQAHFIEDVWAPLKGGAFKCPNDPPYLNEWSCISGGAFTDMVLDTVFGVNVSLDGLTVESRLQPFDPRAELRGFRHHERSYIIDKNGARPA